MFKLPVHVTTQLHVVCSLCRGFFTCVGKDGKVYDELKYVWLQGRQVSLNRVYLLASLAVTCSLSPLFRRFTINSLSSCSHLSNMAGLAVKADHFNRMFGTFIPQGPDGSSWSRPVSG